MLVFIAAIRNKHQHKHAAPILYMTTPYEQRRLNDANGLRFVHEFGWLRTAELGKLLWPNSPACRQAADRLARSWIERQLVIVRELPQGAGRAIVLAAAGVCLLAEHGIAARSGKDIGRHTSEDWLPPATWRHDLIAHGVLCELHRRGYRIYTEVELRRHTKHHVKIPDGFAVKENHGIWLEVEQARKTGKAMGDLAHALSVVASGQASAIAGHKPTVAMVAFVPSSVDERGYVLSHQMRVRNAIQAVAKGDKSIYWAQCTLLGSAGVGHIDFQRELIRADCATSVLKILSASGWRADDGGGQKATYGNYIAHVWKDEYKWGYEVETIQGVQVDSNRADNITEAKRAAASVLSGLNY